MQRNRGSRKGGAAPMRFFVPPFGRIEVRRRLKPAPRQRGNAMIETALFIPIFVLLLIGTAEVARVTYVYYQVQKALYGIARIAGTRNGAYLCDSSDPEFSTIKNFVLAGNSEGGEALITGLTPELVQVRMERQEAGS